MGREAKVLMEALAEIVEIVERARRACMELNRVNAGQIDSVVKRSAVRMQGLLDVERVARSALAQDEYEIGRK